MNWQTATPEEKAAASAAYEVRRAQEEAAAKVAAEQFADKLRHICQALFDQGVPVCLPDSNGDAPFGNCQLQLNEHPEQLIYIAKDGYRHRGRIVISGSWPRSKKSNSVFCPRDGKGGAITVAESKSPEQIAKDIVRRFLPEYREAYAEQVRLKQNEETYEDNKTALTRDLAQALGAKPRPHSPNCVTGYEPTWHEFQINGGDSADIQIHSVTASQALEVIALIKSWAPKNKLRIEV